MPEQRIVSLEFSRDGDWFASGPRITPVRIIHAAMLLLVVSNLGRIPLFDLGDRAAPLLVNDMAVAAVFAGGALAAMSARSLRLDGVALAALLFAAIGGVSALAAGPRFGLSAFEIGAGLAYLARWLLYFTFYVVVVNFVRPRHVESLLGALELAILLFTAFGIVQSIFLPNFALMVYPDQPNAWDAQRHRLVSTVLDPNIAAVMIATVLLLQLARMAVGIAVPLWKPVLLFAGMVLTLSRSGALSLLVGVAIILVARGGLTKRMLRFGMLVGAALILALPKLIAFGMQYARFGISDGSAAARVVTWQRAIETFLEAPWLGTGFNTYGFVQEHRGYERLGSGASYSAEGGLLFIAVMTGIIGLAVFVAMLWLVLRRCRAGWRDAAATPAERALCIGAAAATVAVCIHSVFVNSLLVPFVMQPLWLLWGLVYVVRRRARGAVLESTHAG